MAPSKLDTLHIMEEIRSLAEERRRLLLEGLLDPPVREHVPDDAYGKSVDLCAPVSIAYTGPRRWVIWILDRLRRRFLHSILVRQTLFNEAARASLDDLAARYGAATRSQHKIERAMEELVQHMARMEAELSRVATELGDYDRSGRPKRIDDADTTIEARRRAYVDCFRERGAEGAIVLDVRCETGTFLQLLRAAGLTGRGVDRSADNVACCQKQGLDAIQADALQLLRSTARQGLGGIFAGAIVAHVRLDQLLDFTRACSDALRPGGKLIVETPTRQQISVVRLILESSGFARVETLGGSEPHAVAATR